MTTLLLAFLVVLVLPFFVSSWRTSLFGIALQGLLMAAIVLQREPTFDAETAATIVDLLVVRGVIVPLMLYRVMRASGATARGDVLPPNMITWTLLGVLVAIGFRFASRLDAGGSELLTVTVLSVSVCAVLLGLFVLATQTGTFTQAIGALRIENGIALFELGREDHAVPIAIRIGLSGVFLLTACMYALYVRWMSAPPPEPGTERPAL